MARARNIKHGFFTNDQLAEMPALGRLLFIGLWTIADREGRLEDRPKKIKAEVLPYDECNVDDLLAELQRKKFIVRYQVDGNAYIQIVNFAKHQDPHYKERASVIPAPEGWQSSGRTPAAVPETVRQQVFDRDGRKCKRCGDTENLSLDHIVPRSKGGSHDIDNLQTLCRKCNSAKNNRQAKADVDPTSDQSRAEVGSSEVVTSPLIPDSGFLIPDSIEKHGAAAPTDCADATPTKPDFVAQVFSDGVSLLVASGEKESDARSLLGKLRKKHGDDGALRIIAAARGTSSPKEYIAATFRAKGSVLNL